MFVSTAYAQGAGGGAGGGIEALLPLILIFVVFYFLLIRPQQKKMKQHRDTLSAIRRGDKVVTGGGIVGSVTKVDDDAVVTVEIAKDVKVKVRRELISTVLSKTAPAKGAATPANDDTAKPGGGLLSGLFGGGKSSAPVANQAPEPTNDAEVPDGSKGSKKSEASKGSRKSGASKDPKE